MSANYVKACLGKWLATYTKGVDGGIVLRYKELTTWLYVLERRCGIKLTETCFLKALTQSINGQKVYWRTIEELKKILYHNLKKGLFEFVFLKYSV